MNCDIIKYFSCITAGTASVMQKLYAKSTTMAKIPVLFMCDGHNIASECEGSTAETLISVCSSLFSGLTIQLLQSFDIGWDEWVNLPSDFTLQSRVKLVVVYVSAKMISYIIW